MSDTVYVVQWADGDDALADLVRASGWEVETGPAEVASVCERVSNCLPLAVLVPLEPDPEGACGLGCSLREAGARLNAPVVFVGGIPASRDIARTLLADEPVASFDGLVTVLRDLERHR